MILRQFLHVDPVGISYLIECGGKATVAVIDPAADPATYLEAARAARVKIDYVIDTHIHADHVSTGRALADAASAQYVLPTGADAPPISIVGFENRHSGAFGIANEAEFVRFMLRDIPLAPSAAVRLRAVNSGRAS